MTHKIGGKFIPKWEGPYVIYEVYVNGAYKIVDREGFQLSLVDYSDKKQNKIKSTKTKM